MNFKRCPFAFIFLVVFFFTKNTVAQRKYATTTPSVSGSGFIGVTDKDFLTDADLSNFATMTRFLGDVWLQLKFPPNPIVNIKGGVTTFIRVAASGIDATNYKSYFSFEAFKDANAASNGTKLTGSVHSMFVKNGSEIYLAVTPCEDYNSIRIYISPLNSADVYYGFNGFDTGECNATWAVPAKPITTQNSFAYCEDEDPTVTASVSNPICGLIYTWYDGGTLVQTGASSSYTMPLNSPVGIHNLTVAASRPECGVESVKEAIIVTVNPKPETLNIQSIN